MNDFEREQLARKYFIPIPGKPVGAYAALATGAFGLLIGIAVGGFFGVLLFLGGLFGAIKGSRRYMRYRRDLTMATPRATDDQIDTWLREAITPIVKTGLKRLNVHPTELGSRIEDQAGHLPFIGIPGRGEVDYKRARGTDNKLRFSVYKIVVVYLSDWRLPVYVCHLDIATGTTFNESTKEYALGHVEGMETVSDRLTFYKQREVAAAKPKSDNTQQSTTVECHTQYQAIRLRVSGTSAVELWIKIATDENAQVESAISIKDSSPDQYISALREHLRTRNHGAVSVNPGLAHNGPSTSGGPAQLGPSQLRLPSQFNDGSTQQPGPHPAGE